VLQEEGELLVKTARKTFFAALTEQQYDLTAHNVSVNLLERRGVFVRVARSLNGSWTNELEILGCIGYPLPTRELISATIDATVGCAVRLAAMNELKTRPLDKLLFEVSVLTEPVLIRVAKPIEYPQRIELGKDGLVVQHGLASGVILPQIAFENNYDEKDLLSECCFKAGLAFDAWLMSRDIAVYKFQAEVFRETAIDGKVIKYGPDIPNSFATGE
jgi:uncharacterized protein (TIGR00296 family)